MSNAHEQPDDLLRQERDIRARLAGQSFDFDAGQAIQNIYRAASAVRVQAERDLLSDRGLTWGGFTVLWVLWVWGTTDSSSLAAECGVAKGTLTGMVTTLEKRGLVRRDRSTSDRRRVEVALTMDGEEMIADLYPRFNRQEIAFTQGLDVAEQRELSRLLRRVINNVG